MDIRCEYCDYCQYPRTANDNNGHCKCKAMKRKTIAQNSQKALEVTIEEIEKAEQEVAREIFEEIDRCMLDGEIAGKYPVKVMHPDKYAELKKKYIG